MPNLIVQPTTFAEIAEACMASERLLPVGAQTKSGLLAEDAADLSIIDMRGHNGIVNYDPSEFLVSAKAGTTIAQLAQILAAEGQYLPFDPVLADHGATLGGSIASGVSGPCRLLYGGLRDFMLEVQMCNGEGREVRGGGKVVKNAAGFDLPKLLVGSYGRMGIITEATLKVFPQPPGTLTVRVNASSLRAAVDIGMKLLALPLPISALEIEPPQTLLIRLAGPLDSLAGMADRITAQLPVRQAAQRMEPGADETQFWYERSEFAWADDYAALVRVAIAHHQCVDLTQRLTQLGDACQCVLSCGASVAWIALRELDDQVALDQVLSELTLAGVALRGPKSLRFLGDRRWVAPADRIRHSLDTSSKYLKFGT
ncbi:MAG: FAD-binding protein [Pirellulaceae bacterium]|nr:FAD-binding protein [Pirellulaceae bacterium]